MKLSSYPEKILFLANSLSKNIASNLGKLLSPLACKFKTFKLVRHFLLTLNREKFYLISHENSYLALTQDQAISYQMYISGMTNELDKLLEVRDLLASYNIEVDSILDIGANIGTVSIEAVASLGFTKAWSIEPDKTNYNLLVANVALNNLLDSIDCYNVAAGAECNTEVVLELSSDNYGDHRIKVLETPGVYKENLRDSYMVPCQSIDSLIPCTNSQLIWIDVQGYEGQVLSGASKFIRASTPIFFEFWPYGLDRANSLESLLKSIKNSTYNLMIVFYTSGEIITHKFTVEQLLCIHDELKQPFKSRPEGTHADILLLTVH